MATLTFTGRMKAPPEEKDLPNGGKVLNFDVAEDTGKDETTWHNNIAVYDGSRLFDFIKAHFAVKGKPITCTCDYRKKEGKAGDGTTRYYDRLTLLSVNFVPGGKKPEGDSDGAEWGE